MRKQFTLSEYQSALKEPIKHPDPNNFEDPLYYVKHAHTMVPLITYSVRPRGYELQCSPTDAVSRQVFYCWNTLSEYEVN